MTENSYATAKKLYIILGDDTPENESKRLMTDLGMFADKTVEMY